jgi:GNAT superfamily N-acetyltransferase
MQLADVDGIAEVHIQVWREAYASLMPSGYLADLDQEQFARSWRGRLEGQQSAEVMQLLGLSPDAPIVAIGSARPSRDEDAPKAWELFAINVLAAAHGTGLADLMMAELVGDRPSSLWVLDGNKRALAFYARYGFVPDGATTKHEPSGRVELRLVRN